MGSNKDNIKARIKPEEATLNTVIIERVQELIKEQKWSKKSMSEFLGAGIGGYSSSKRSGDYDIIKYLESHKTISKKILNNLAFCLNVTIEYLTGESDDNNEAFNGIINSDFTHCYVISKDVVNAFNDTFIKRYHIPKHIIDWLKSDDRLVTENIAKKAVTWYLNPATKGVGSVSIESDATKEAMLKYTRKIELNKSNKRIYEEKTDNSKIVQRILSTAKDINMPIHVLIELSSIDGGEFDKSNISQRCLRDYIKNKFSYENADSVNIINNIAWVLNVDIDFLLCKHDDISLSFKGVRTIGKHSCYQIDLSHTIRMPIILRNYSRVYACPIYLENWLYGGERRVSKLLVENIIESIKGDKWYKNNYLKKGELPNWVTHLYFDECNNAYNTEPPIKDKPEITFEPITTPIKYSDTLADVVNNHLPKLNNEDLGRLKYILERSYEGMPISDMPRANDVIIHAEEYPEEDIIAMQNAFETIHPIKKDKELSDDSVMNYIKNLNVKDLDELIMKATAIDLTYKDDNYVDEIRYKKMSQDFVSGLSRHEAIVFKQTICETFNLANCYEDFTVRICKAIKSCIEAGTYPVYPVDIETEPTSLRYVLESEDYYYIQAGIIKQMKTTYDSENKMNDIKCTVPEIVNALMTSKVAVINTKDWTALEVVIFNKKFIMLKKSNLNKLIQDEKAESITTDSVIEYLDNLSDEERKQIVSKYIEPPKEKTFIEVLNDAGINEVINTYLPTLSMDDIKAIRRAINIIDPPKPNEIPITLAGINKDFIPNASPEQLANLYITINHALPDKYKISNYPVPLAVVDLLSCLTSAESAKTIIGLNGSHLKTLGTISLKHIIGNMVRMDQKDFMVLRDAIISVTDSGHIEKTISKMNQDESTKEQTETSVVEQSKTIKNEIIEVFKSCIGHDESTVQFMANEWLKTHPGYAVKLIDHTTMPSMEYYGGTDQVMTIVFST